MTLIADTSAQQLLPRNFQPVNLRVSTTASIHEVKEQLCVKVGPAISAQSGLVIQTLNGGVFLNDAMTVAHYNLADQTQLIFSAAK